MDYHKIVLAHRIFVSLFLVHYVVKLALLLIGKKDLLANYTAKTKVLEMIISALFLLTGFYLVYAGPALVLLQWIKIAVVFASIPIAIVGFKKQNKILAILAVVMVVAAYGMAEVAKKQRTRLNLNNTENSTALELGKAIYTQQCVACHGPGGDAMIGAAKNLRVSTLTENEMAAIIVNGKEGMPPFNTLTEEQLLAVVQYVKTLKQ